MGNEASSGADDIAEVCQSAAGSSDSDKEGLPESRIDSEEDGLPERHGLGAVDAVVDD